MSTHLLERRTHRPKPGIGFLGQLSLAGARAHEFCGPARRTLALILAAAVEGPVFWIAPGWSQDRLHGEGVVALIDPGRLTFVSPRRPEDILWSMEEVLRSGLVPLVVCELPGLPGLTPVRRLHLAAETATREAGAAPVGLLLLPGSGGAPGVESRWHMAPKHARDQSRWRLERRRARMAPPAAWDVVESGAKFRLETRPEGHPDRAGG